MWTPLIDKMKSLSESERLEKAENNIRTLEETIDDLEKRVKELEKKKNDK